jgi:hypothetical protein
MKHNARIVFVIISLTVLSMTVAPQIAAEECSTARVAGSWGATLTGTILLPTGGVPAAAVLRIRADDAGNFSGTEERNVGGQFAHETITGHWTVQSDCTGTVRASIFESGVLTRRVVLSVVFDDDSRQLRMVQQSLTLPVGTSIPVVVTLEGRKLSGDENHR